MLKALEQAAARADRLRSEASDSLRLAVGSASDDGFTQTQIANAIGRSQPEVSRLIKEHRTRRFRPRTRLGRQVARHRDEIVSLAHDHRADNIRVFGSVAHGTDDEHSDIDFLVDLRPGADLIDLAALAMELERLLGRRVDVVPARMLKPHVTRTALDEAVPL